MFFPKEVIVCESMIDALTAWQYGKYAVALNGLGTALQFKQLRDLPCRKIILATDADEAGMQARERIMKNVSNKLITQYVWDVHVAKDLNDMDKEMFDNLKEIL
jgi:DNA primase